MLGGVKSFDIDKPLSIPSLTFVPEYFSLPSCPAISLHCLGENGTEPSGIGPDALFGLGGSKQFSLAQELTIASRGYTECSGASSH